MSISAEFKTVDGKKVQSFEVVPKDSSLLGDVVDSLRTLQQETNAFLTGVIQAFNKSEVNNGAQIEDADDDMEGESEESDSDETPPSKLAKT